MKQEDEYFIRISDPKNTRRVILESTRDTIKILQGYEEYKKVRQQRTQLIEQFKAGTAEIKSIVKEINRLLPKGTKETRKTIIKTDVVEKAPKELKQLDDQLSAIESKLNEL